MLPLLLLLIIMIIITAGSDYLRLEDSKSLQYSTIIPAVFYLFSLDDLNSSMNFKFILFLYTLWNCFNNDEQTVAFIFHLFVHFSHEVKIFVQFYTEKSYI